MVQQQIPLKKPQVIRRNFNGVWTDWLGNSPALTVIENLWAKFQDSMFRQPRSHNREQLIVRVKKEWAYIDKETTMEMTPNFENHSI